MAKLVGLKRVAVTGFHFKLSLLIFGLILLGPFSFATETLVAQRISDDPVVQASFSGAYVQKLEALAGQSAAGRTAIWGHLLYKAPNEEVKTYIRTRIEAAFSEATDALLEKIIFDEIREVGSSAPSFSEKDFQMAANGLFVQVSAKPLSREYIELLKNVATAKASDCRARADRAQGRVLIEAGGVCVLATGLTVVATVAAGNYLNSVSTVPIGAIAALLPVTTTMALFDRWTKVWRPAWGKDVVAQTTFAGLLDDHVVRVCESYLDPKK